MPQCAKTKVRIVVDVYMNDHPMSQSIGDVSQLDPAEVAFRYDGLTSLFNSGLDFWWCECTENECLMYLLVHKTLSILRFGSSVISFGRSVHT